MQRQIFRIVVILLCAALFLCACTNEPFSKNDQFAVLGKIEPSSKTKYFDFLLQLNELYPKSQAILTATVQNQSDGCLLIDITQVFKGIETSYSSFYIRNTTDLKFQDREEYLFYLTTPELKEDDHNIHYDIVKEQSDPNVIKDDLVYPQNGSSVALLAIIEEISKLNTTVPVPAYFQYYRDLSKLVEGSDLILIGTVEEILPEEPLPFYVRDEGFEEMFTENAQAVRIVPGKILKGDTSGDLTILRSQSMVYNTINETTLQPTSYTERDLPPLETGVEYLFFLVGKSDLADSGYCYMVNPFEGYVQIFDDQLMSIPINAALSFSEFLPDILSQIEDLVNGKSVTVHYPPFVIEPTPAN